MRTITRPLEAHAYSAGDPQRGAAQPVGHVIIHEATPAMPHPGVTPVSSPHAPIWSADGAPFYNSGYVYPQHGPLQTGGAVTLRLPGLAAMIDLSDMTTWDRPVWMDGVR
ncbi:MAG TPA: hypothetical protein VGR98_12295 [Streptosporangiaceae bacterium]|nr:hypothetical protein [Streptosporangiaceae bacterium]